jgi:hypothetical protein
MLLFALASITGAQERVAGDLGKVNLGEAPVSRAVVSKEASSTSFHQVLGREFTVLPGYTTWFEWGTDLTGSQKVGISITTLSDVRSSLSNVRIGVAFAGPGDWYVITDVIHGSDFFYIDHGGATVSVYGPFMKLLITNDGPTPIRITQVSAYAVVH